MSSTTSNGSDLTLEEIAESLNGYDELGIEQHFGSHINTLLEGNPTIGIRALIFIDVKRTENLNVQQAKQRAMDLSIKEVTEWFADDEGDFDPENPDSVSGKGDGSPT